MSVTTEEIVEEFEAFGIQVKNDNLLEKCIGLCGQYDLTADQLAANWLGYAATHRLDDMTEDRLDNFDREVLGKKKGNNNLSQKTNSKYRIYTVDTIDQLNTEDDILLSYGAAPSTVWTGEDTTCSLPHVGKQPPSTPRASLLRKGGLSPHVGHLSPGVSQPCKRYSGRTNSGALAAHISTSADDNVSDKLWAASKHFTPKLTVSSLSSNEHKVMFEKLRDVASVQEEAILHMADEIVPAFGGDECVWNSLCHPTNERISVVGRVCCDSVGKLNAASVLLEGSRAFSEGHVMPLDLSSVPQYALFPGQVVGITGVNSTGSSIVVEEVVGGRVPPFPEHPINITEQTGPVQMVVACGPFTTTDNLLYEPLDDLLVTIAHNPPHLLVLLGPLLDVTHPLFSTDMTETYQAVVNRVLATVTTALAKCNTEVFVVASYRDSTSSGVYPTSGLTCSPSLPSSRLHMLSDPSMLVVEGVAVALTTMDVILDLGREELAFPTQQGDRLSRLVQHVLAQQVLYPVSPPPDNVSVSPQLLHQHASLNCKPHVIVLPSDLRHFAKEVCECVAVNPERLCKGASGGSYARIELSPPSEEQPYRPNVVAAVYKV